METASSIGRPALDFDDASTRTNAYSERWGMRETPATLARLLHSQADGVIKEVVERVNAAVHRHDDGYGANENVLRMMQAFERQLSEKVHRGISERSVFYVDALEPEREFRGQIAKALQFVYVFEDLKVAAGVVLGELCAQRKTLHNMHPKEREAIDVTALMEATRTVYVKLVDDVAAEVYNKLREVVELNADLITSKLAQYKLSEDDRVYVQKREHVKTFILAQLVGDMVDAVDLVLKNSSNKANVGGDNNVDEVLGQFASLLDSRLADLLKTEALLLGSMGAADHQSGFYS